MTDESKEPKGAVKTIRLSVQMHAAFQNFRRSVRRDTAEEAMQLLLAEDVIRIPMPREVMERWRAEADASGFPLEQWVAQRVEGYLANRAYAGEVRRALNELVMLRKAMSPAALAYALHTTGDGLAPAQTSAVPEAGA